MTHGIREFLNIDADPIEDDENSDNLSDMLANLKAPERYDSTLGDVDHASSMDDLTTEMVGHAREITEMAFNSEPTLAAKLLAVSANLYKSAVSAKTQKRDAQIAALKILLEDRKVKVAERAIGGLDAKSAVIDGQMLKGDRNEILRQAREAAEKSQTD